MSRHFPKLLWSLAFVLGLGYLVHGFSLKAKSPNPNVCTSNTEKCSDAKVQTGLDIKNITHHLLDFYK
ncbi:hypothetical protein BH10BAC3_BH10BAC3_29590 [soil metagenome]